MGISLRKGLWVWLAVMVLMTRPLAAAEWLELADFMLFDGTGSERRAVERLVVRDGVIVGIDDVDGPIPGSHPSWICSAR